MTVRFLRLALALFFLAGGAGLLVLRFGFPDVANRLNSPMRLFLAGIFGLVLGGLNLVRWYASIQDFQRRATPVRRPLQREPGAPREEEPNADFDFGKQDEH
jgi:hypothetical protein